MTDRPLTGERFEKVTSERLMIHHSKEAHAGAPVPPGSGSTSSLEHEEAEPRGEDPVDLLAMSVQQFQVWLLGYGTGYLHGLERGGDQRDEEWQRIHNRAVKIVRAMATLPPHPPKTGEPKW